MHEVTSRNDRKPTRRFIIGKPANQPAHLQEVDLEALLKEIREYKCRMVSVPDRYFGLYHCTVPKF